jgi:hypothetical protein
VSAYSCAQVRDIAPELALGVLSGAERAEALIHVNGCARCQALVTELSEVADVLPLLAPEHEPPPGFEQRVLGAGRANRRRATRRWVAAIAAAVAAAAIVSITLVRVIEADQGSSVAAPSPKPAEAAMVTDVGGWPAGWAYVTNRTSLAVAVGYEFESGTYQIVATPRHGDAVTVGSIAITDGRGSWTGSSPVPLPAGSTIQLVSLDGHVVCHGTVAAHV